MEIQISVKYRLKLKKETGESLKGKILLPKLIKDSLPNFLLIHAYLTEDPIQNS
ncbi:MAG: hypothetical protein ACM3ZS_05985 [Nitrososphaerota archaeon]